MIFKAHNLAHRNILSQERKIVPDFPPVFLVWAKIRLNEDVRKHFVTLSQLLAAKTLGGVMGQK